MLTEMYKINTYPLANHIGGYTDHYSVDSVYCSGKVIEKIAFWFATKEAAIKELNAMLENDAKRVPATYWKDGKEAENTERLTYRDLGLWVSIPCEKY
jgi:hypothetical protein